MKKFWLSFFLIFCVLFTYKPNYIQAGFFSKIGKLVFSGGKKISKKVAKEAGEKASKSVLKKKLSTITIKYGDDVARKVSVIASKASLKSRVVANELIKHGTLYKKLNFADDAIRFGLKSKAAGRSLLKQADLNYLRKAGWMKPKASKSVNQVWRLTDRHAIGGSFSRLQKTMSKAKISPKDCSICKNVSGKDPFPSKFKRLNANPYKPGRPFKLKPNSPPPKKPGEYYIKDKTGKYKYIGETNNLNRRLYQHKKAGKFKKADSFEYKKADGRSTSRTRRLHERDKIKKHEPYLNKSGGGEGRIAN